MSVICSYNSIAHTHKLNVSSLEGKRADSQYVDQVKNVFSSQCDRLRKQLIIVLKK